jgi:methanogenic corrinoid protein MtbC1
VERLRLIRLAINAGRRIGQVAALDLASLRELVDEDRAAEGSRPRDASTAPDSAERDFVVGAMIAVKACDAGRLRHVLQRAMVTLSPDRFLEQVARPLMGEIGRLWAAGEMSPGHEHMASGVLRQILTQLAALAQPVEGAPHIVVATLALQAHELGAMMVSAVAALEGWRTTFLAGDLPAEEIARVAELTGARAVAVSVTTPAENVSKELERLASLTGDGVALLVGGQAAAGYDDAIRAAGAVSLRDIPSLRAVLQALAVAA